MCGTAFRSVDHATQIKGQSTLFKKKTEEAYKCTTNKWIMQSRPTEEGALVEQLKKKMLFD